VLLLDVKLSAAVGKSLRFIEPKLFDSKVSLLYKTELNPRDGSVDPNKGGNLEVSNSSAAGDIGSLAKNGSEEVVLTISASIAGFAGAKGSKISAPETISMN
jgi:hypothetical protein